MATKSAKVLGTKVIKTTEQFVLVIKHTGKIDWRGHEKVEYFLCPSMDDAKTIFGSTDKQYVTMVQVQETK